jgi:hypothetical protein
VGAAFIGLAGSERERFFAWLARARLATSLRIKGAEWCRPELRVKVRHLAGSDGLRHASFEACFKEPSGRQSRHKAIQLRSPGLVRRTYPGLLLHSVAGRAAGLRDRLGLLAFI